MLFVCVHLVYAQATRHETLTLTLTISVGGAGFVNVNVYSHVTIILQIGGVSPAFLASQNIMCSW